MLENMTEPNKVSDAWSTLNWKQIQRCVYRLQQRIYRASQRGDIRSVQSLQRLLTKSRSAKLLATRRVTQENTGKKTAGVDGVKSLTPKQRLRLADTLALGKKADPLRRVWIPKPGKTEKRGLGIPTMQERGVQALALLALEPAWEAIFEPNSYGFRPGRSTHDAVEQIFHCIKLHPKWCLDADIKGCFDRINHDALLQNLSQAAHPSIVRQVKAWLQAGVMADDELQVTQMGTPQGGVISPLLANIALDGLEKTITKAIKGAKVVRFADDFVILHKDIQAILKAKEMTASWLNNVGLELRDDKTRITHTLDGGKDYQTGFDFLGFNIRQYPTPRRRMNKSQRPYKTHIKPSQEKIKRLVKRLGDVIKQNRGISQCALIAKLNPIIKGWANYNRGAVAKRIFANLDTILYAQLKRWAERRHPLKGKRWVKDRYWHTVGQSNWVFGVEQNGLVVLKLASFSETPISRHIKVKSEKSWYDGDWAYWAVRRGKHPLVGTCEATLLKRQSGRCAICRDAFDLYDRTEIDHVNPRSNGGKDVYSNLQLLHQVCHHAKTSWDRKGLCPIRPWANTEFPEGIDRRGAV